MKNLMLAVFALCVFSAQAQITAPQPSPAAKIEQMVGLTDVHIEYSRPAANGRVVFGNLVPYGEVWRTGANENTKITFTDDVQIDGKDLKKGTYALYTIPNETNWDVIFYSDATNWGNPRAWDESKVALKTNVNATKTVWDFERFTIAVDDMTNDDAMVRMMWENAMVSFKVTVPTDMKTMASIDATMSGPSANDYFNAASYYHEAGKDLNTAMGYAQKAVEMNPNAFWMFRRLSLIQADLGMTSDAISTAETSLSLAKKAGNADYVKMNEDSIKEWSSK